MAQNLSNLPTGAKVKFGNYQVESETAQPIIWTVVAKNHQGYPTGSTTLLAEKIIDLRGFDAKEPSNSNSDRKTYGNNRYRDSNLRQWLNKGGSPWFQKTHTADEPPTDGGMNRPTGYDAKDGFLSAFTDEELAVILDTDLTVALNTVTDGGGSETVTDKVFLLSNTEVGLANENNIVEGGLLPLFTNGASRISYLTQQAFDNTKATSKPADVSTAWYWWLRTPSASNSRNVRYVNTAGSLHLDSAYTGNLGVRPALNLSSSLLVSDSTDSDGCYTLNEPPVISGSDGNLGTKTAGFSQTYTVSDAEEDNITVTERIDGVLIRSYPVVLGATNTFSVTGETWLKLTNGSHSMTITATNSFGNSSVRTYTFTKNVTSFSILTAIPMESSTMPTRLSMSISRNIPPESTFLVEVCNNGFDVSPTWEDATSAVIGNLVHVFSNTSKTAIQWGVSVRVTVHRNGASGACYVNAIGGNFE